MSKLFQIAWDEVVVPFIRRPDRVQIAALCFRSTSKGKEVLLITSRDTGRWILPKGWPIEGKDAKGSALQEAWEEAGVEKGTVSDLAIGSFHYQKQLDSGGEATCKTQVFPIEVAKLANDFPECEERRRKWVTLDKAARMVQEPELKEILQSF